MTTPNILLCCRCSFAELADSVEGRRWHQFTMPRSTTLDICPRCAVVLLNVLRQTPDILEDEYATQHRRPR